MEVTREKSMENRPNWTSRYAFILATIGSAVGLGNIWRFPYIMGQHGGAVFLITYLILITTICFIPLLAELSIGKITQKECIGAYESINPRFKYLGMMNPVACILVAAFYFVVGGWIINYIYLGCTDFEANNYATYFSSFTQNSIPTCILTIIFLFTCIFFTARGIKKGVEVANNIMMPLLAVILIGLVIYSLNLPNAGVGLAYMFKPDFSKINGEMFLCALGQALFTLSIGMGTILTYGSYIKDDKNIAKSAYSI
ncbi:sodium-dependent transporter, partial [bacterium]|nr:sodium-dependent transporter [bacterium]